MSRRSWQRACLPWLLLLAAAALPSVRAEFTLTAVGPTEPVMPEIDVAPLEVRVEVDCMTILQAAAGASAAPVSVNFTVEEPSLVVQGPRTLTLGAQGCLSGATHVSQNATYGVTAMRLAPGLVPLRIAIAAELQGQSGLLPVSEHAEAEAAVTVGYYPYIAARVVDADRQGAPGSSIAFTLQVENFGNARTSVAFHLPEPPEGWSWTVPPPLVLEAPGAGAPSSGNVTVTVMGTGDGGWTNREQAIRVTMTPSATMDPGLVGTPIEVSFMAHVRSAPDAGPLLMVGLAAAALLRSRRSD